ncbi:MAG: sugar ABC transporter ATP-binding protein [Methylobacteriaceae bacterium]|nr:sugar ABC transporter ATP-binding protein [Methylobacteriaceae bacterium]
MNEAARAPLLRAESLNKSFFGVQVLHDISFELRPGAVLGLVGENGSGKSTTMNIIGGVHLPDSGRMALDGAVYEPRGPRDAQLAGIAFIHQELNLFKNLTIMENLFIERFPKRFNRLPLIDRGAIRARAAALLAEVDLHLSPATPVGRLSQGERQLVEIAKALSAEARIIIFDEPTTSLTARETERLFAIIRRLRSRGIAIIYISHILRDVIRLCDEMVVLRDGHVVGASAAAAMSIERMISLMVGRTIDQMFPARSKPPEPGAPVLEVRGLTQPGIVKDISFSLHRGEVLGISGLMGSGRSEMARILFGLDPYEAGEIIVAGERLARASPGACMDRGMAFLTEDRRVEGLMMEASIADNIALPSLTEHSTNWLRLIERTRLGEDVRKASRSVQITARDIYAMLVKHLSGGNQQKVVIAKWLMRSPRVFILDEPTRGIDVGAKYEIYKLINQLAAEGTGILLISSEIEELIGMCDRILAMGHGEIRGTHDRLAFDREAILKSAMWDGFREAV